jgi:Ca2+-binding RTX toxin-like protein
MTHAQAVSGVTATFDATLGILNVVGDDTSNSITVTKGPNNTLIVNGGSVVIDGGTPNLNNTILVQVFGNGGNDQLDLSDLNAPQLNANLFGGAGNDTLNAGTRTAIVEGGDDVDTIVVEGTSSAESYSAVPNFNNRVRFDRVSPNPYFLDIATAESLNLNMAGGADTFTGQNGISLTGLRFTVDGGPGNDTILGTDNPDVLNGGDGNDFIDGQRGDDVALMGNGNDTFQWDPGDGSDTVEGQDGNDSLRFNGSNAAETIDVSANGSRTRFIRNIANITMDLNDVEQIDFQALGGADIVNVNDLSGTATAKVNVNLAALDGTGDVAIDTVVVNGTAADDVIKVRTVDGSAFVEGLAAVVRVDNAEPASDIVLANGLGGNDTFDPSKLNANLVRFQFQGSEGTDNATFTGTGAAESLFAVPNGTLVFVGELSPNTFNFEVGGTTENLNVNLGGGNDSFTGQNGLAQTGVKLSVDGGSGDDTILGGDGADTLIGGAGADFIDGQRGDDLALMGSGNDTFQWDPGDGSDTVEGDGGIDSLRFNGSNAGETVEVSANGPRTRFTRNIANIAMDLNDVEQIDFRALGAADVMIVNDLAGTDTRTVSFNLAAFDGAGDAAADMVIVNGTAGDDVIKVRTADGSTFVEGLAAVVRVDNAEPTLDTVFVNGQGGNDTFDPSRLTATLARYQFSGSDGTDKVTLNGTSAAESFFAAPNGTFFHVGQISPNTFGFEADGTTENINVNMGGGNDSFTGQNGLAQTGIKLAVEGGSGDDTILGGDGDDTLIGGDGADFIDGQRGNDLALMGSDDDTFQWDPGDGNDTVEGQGGSDIMRFNGSNAGETVEVSANGPRTRFTRNIGNITMDLNDVEQIDFLALGAADVMIVDDLKGTDTKRVNLNLAAFGGVPDATADNVIVNGSSGNDKITIDGNAGAVVVGGLAATVSITNSDGLADVLTVNGQDGVDRITVDSTTLPAGTISLVNIAEEVVTIP